MLKMHGGHLRPDNVRLAHRHCNRRDFQWRKRINGMLAKRMSLVEIAEKLKRGGGSDGPRHEPVDGRVCSEGVRVLAAPWWAARKSRARRGRLSSAENFCHDHSWR